MKECINCGYERQPKDDEQGLVPRTECPRCGAIYEKMEKLKEKNTVAIHPDRSRWKDDKRSRQDSKSGVKATKSSHIFVSLIIIAICVSAGYYYYVNKQKEALKIAQVRVRIFTTSQ
jgi:Zn ribbon nucleic-acid-binding protein